MSRARDHLASIVDSEVVEYREAIDQIARGHLAWVFRKAIRPQVFWVRSYLVSGKPKDGPTFQLDTQCYPLLELCNYYESYPEDELLVQAILAEGVPAQILGLLWSKQDPLTGLFPTDETPADDEVEYPFLLSNHILLWYTLSRIVQLLGKVGESPDLKISDLAGQAEILRKAVLSYFVTARPTDGELFFAYLSDGKGAHTFYHDANDLPTLFAVKWGFIKDEYELRLWKNTMEWGISPANEKGVYGDGHPFAGLGSVHTPSPWTLGYYQELMYAYMIGSKLAQDDVWRRIHGVMPFDGTFPEAVDAKTGGITSKAWFSWAGCMIASAFIPGLREMEEIMMEA